MGAPGARARHVPGRFSHRFCFERQSARNQQRWQLRNISLLRRQANPDYQHFAAVTIPIEHVNGNFLPSISDDGRYIAFSSNRNLTNQNADGNLEIFIYDSVAPDFHSD